MSVGLRPFIGKLDVLNKSIKAGTRVQSAAKRRELSKLAESYFNEVRPSILPKDQQLPELVEVDGAFQELMPLCHFSASAGKYKALLAKAKSALVRSEVSLISRPRVEVGFSMVARERRIASTLEALLPSAANSYRQALEDLAVERRQSWRGPATDLRESLREVLDHLAPDADVSAQAGFKLEQNAHGPTMKQKVRFVLKSRGSPSVTALTTESAAVAVEEALGQFVRSVYTRSSASTHTPTERQEVVRIKELVEVVLSELLEISH
jgi:hypothetical protein